MSMISTPISALASKENSKHFYNDFGVLPKVGVTVLGLIGVSGYIAVKCWYYLNSTVYDDDDVKSSLKNKAENKVMLSPEEPEKSIKMYNTDAKLKSTESKFTEMLSTKATCKEFKGAKEATTAKSQKSNIVSRYSKLLFFTLTENVKTVLECMTLEQLWQLKREFARAFNVVFPVFTKTYTSNKTSCTTKDADDDNDDSELFTLVNNSPLFSRVNTTIDANRQNKTELNNVEALCGNQHLARRNGSQMENQSVHRKIQNNVASIGKISRSEIANTNTESKNNDIVDNDIDDNPDSNDKSNASKVQLNETASSSIKEIVTKDINWPCNIVNRTKALGMVHALIRKIRKAEVKKDKVNTSDSVEKNAELPKEYNDNNDSSENDDFYDDDDDYIDDDEVTNSDTTDVSLNYHIASSMERETYDELVEFLNERKANNSLLFDLHERNNNSALLEMLTKIAEYLDISNEREKLRERRAYLHFSDGAELADLNSSEFARRALTSGERETKKATQNVNKILDQIEMAKTRNDDKHSTASSKKFEEIADKTLMSTEAKAKTERSNENVIEELNKINVESLRESDNTVLEEKLKKTNVLENRWFEEKLKLDTELFEHGWGAQDYYNQDKLHNFQRYLSLQDDDDDDADFMAYLEQNDAAEQFYNRDEIRMRRRDPANRMRIVSEHTDLFEGIGDTHASGTKMYANDYNARGKTDEIDSADDFNEEYFNSENYSPDYDDYLHSLYKRGEKSCNSEKRNYIMNSSANLEHLLELESVNKKHNVADEFSYLKENNNSSNNNNSDNTKINKKNFTTSDQVNVTNELRQLHRANMREVLYGNKNLDYLKNEQYANAADKKTLNSNVAAKVNLRETYKITDTATEGKINKNNPTSDDDSKDVDDDGYCDEYDYDEYMEKLYFDNYVDREQNSLEEKYWLEESEEEEEEEWGSEEEDNEQEEEELEEEEEEEEENEIEEEEWPLQEKLAFEEELIEHIYNLAHQLRVSESMGQKELDAANAARERRHAAVKAQNESNAMEASDRINERKNYEEKEPLSTRWEDNKVANHKVDSSDDCDEWEDVSSTDSESERYEEQ